LWARDDVACIGGGAGRAWVAERRWSGRQRAACPSVLSPSRGGPERASERRGSSLDGVTLCATFPPTPWSTTCRRVALPTLPSLGRVWKALGRGWWGLWAQAGQGFPSFLVSTAGRAVRVRRREGTPFRLRSPSPHRPTHPAGRSGWAWVPFQGGGGGWTAGVRPLPPSSCIWVVRSCALGPGTAARADLLPRPPLNPAPAPTHLHQSAHTQSTHLFTRPMPPKPPPRSPALTAPPYLTSHASCARPA
jgi:hypothetical protein